MNEFGLLGVVCAFACYMFLIFGVGKLRATPRWTNLGSSIEGTVLSVRTFSKKFFCWQADYEGASLVYVDTWNFLYSPAIR